MNPYLIIGGMLALGASGTGGFFYGKHIAKLECSRAVNLKLDEGDKRVGVTEGKREEIAAAGAGRHDELATVISTARARLARRLPDPVACPAWLPADSVRDLNTAIAAANGAGFLLGDDVYTADAATPDKP